MELLVETHERPRAAAYESGRYFIATAPGPQTLATSRLPLTYSTAMDCFVSHLLPAS